MAHFIIETNPRNCASKIWRRHGEVVNPLNCNANVNGQMVGLRGLMNLKVVEGQERRNVFVE
jgi:hypothetical protein